MPTDLLLLAQLCNISYCDDIGTQNASLAALGFEMIVPRYENVDHRAILVRNSGLAGAIRHILVLCGTRFSDGNIAELFDDDDLLPVDVGNGWRVMQGFHAGLAELFAWATASVPPGASMDITGHSLGGARAHLAPLFLGLQASAGRITSFGAPKAANNVYWKALPSLPVRVVHERDFAPSWPLVTLWGNCQPEPMTWLHAGVIEDYTQAQWWGDSKGDHDIANGYAAFLQALAAPKAA